MHEYQRKYRPDDFSQVQGQEATIAYLEGKLKKKQLPHCLLFTGPSGVGKTTIARITACKLDCSIHDLTELNMADFRGIDTVREIRKRMGLSPINGKCRVWILDEIHRLTTDSQNSLLKLLEEPPKHVYFMLATTDPQKLLKTILTRCTEVKLEALSSEAMQALIASVLEQEKQELSEEVIDRIVEVADGSARKALVILEQIADLDSEEEQLAAVQNADCRRQAIELARVLIKPKPLWNEVRAVLSGLETEDVEGLRHLVLGYARKVLLGGGKLAPRAYLVITSFRDPFYESKAAGLAAACWEVCSQ